MMFEQIKEDQGQKFSEFTDGDYSRRTYYRVIAIGSAVNVLSWVVALITPETIAEWIGFVANFSNRAQALLLAFPFWSTFFASYAALRIPRYSNATAVVDDDGVMSSYRDTERSNYIGNRVLLALSAAALNTVILVFTVITLR